MRTTSLGALAAAAVLVVASAPPASAQTIDGDGRSCGPDQTAVVYLNLTGPAGASVGITFAYQKPGNQFAVYGGRGGRGQLSIRAPYSSRTIHWYHAETSGGGHISNHGIKCQ